MALRNFMIEPTANNSIKNKVAAITILLSLFIFSINLFFTLFLPFAIIAFVINASIILVVQFIIYFIVRKLKIRPIVEVVLLLLPYILLLIYSLTANLYGQPINQRQGIKSASGKYQLSVPIEKGIKGKRVWKVTIKDIDGRIIYKDEESNFIGILNVYWIWDKDDNAWLYNSDDGSVYFWTLKGKKWQKSVWNKDEQGNLNMTPPKDLFPHYYNEVSDSVP